MTETSELFEGVVEEWGQPTSRRPIPGASIEKYRGDVPGGLLRLWAEYGECRFRSGQYFLVDPGCWQSVVDEWLSAFDLSRFGKFVPIARTAFGKIQTINLYFGEGVRIMPLYGSVNIPREGSAPVPVERLRGAVYGAMTTPPRLMSHYDESDESLYDRAFAKLGPLDWDEMYGFVPALPMGGRNRLENLEKVKWAPYLSMLRQITDLRGQTINIDPAIIQAAVASSLKGEPPSKS